MSIGFHRLSSYVFSSCCEHLPFRSTTKTNLFFARAQLPVGPYLISGDNPFENKKGGKVRYLRDKIVNIRVCYDLIDIIWEFTEIT